MEAKKCGAFIAELRKERNWNQTDLAQQQGVTNKAVSRWETGKGYPDVVTLKLLSELFDISVNDILCGERIREEDQLEKAEETILKAMAPSKQDLLVSLLFGNNVIVALIELLAGVIFTTIAGTMLWYGDLPNSFVACSGIVFVFWGIIRILHRNTKTSFEERYEAVKKNPGAVDLKAMKKEFWLQLFLGGGLLGAGMFLLSKTGTDLALMMTGQWAPAFLVGSICTLAGICTLLFGVGNKAMHWFTRRERKKQDCEEPHPYQ